MDNLVQWDKIWQMDFNVNKCAVLSITTKRKPSIYTYTMNERPSSWQPRLSWSQYQHQAFVETSHFQGPLQSQSHSGPHQVDAPCSCSTGQEGGIWGTCQTLTGICHMFLVTLHQIGHTNYRENTEIGSQASQMITSVTPASPQCSTSLCGTRWRSNGAFEMLPFFFKIFHGHVNIPLPPIVMVADSQTRCLGHMSTPPQNPGDTLNICCNRTHSMVNVYPSGTVCPAKQYKQKP